jgi:hypothetical protein
VPFNDILRLLKLVRLDLSQNASLSDANLETISTMKGLTSLDLSDCGNDGKVSIDGLCAALTSLRNLKELNLKDFVFIEQVISAEDPHGSTGFTGQVVEFRHPFLTQLPLVKQFDLSPGSERNLIECLRTITSLEILTLPPGISQWDALGADLTNLKYLCLAAANLTRLSDYQSKIEEISQELESWVSRIDAFRVPVLFYGMIAGSKHTLLGVCARSEKYQLLDPIIHRVEKRCNASLNVNFSEFGVDAPIFSATGSPATFKALIDAGANINAISFSSKVTGVYTPLRAVLWRGFVDVIKLALDLGADPFVGPAIIDTFDKFTHEAFDFVWERLKDRILDYDEQTLSAIVVAAFERVCRRGDSYCLEKVLNIIGNDRAITYIKQNEPRIVQEYLRLPSGPLGPQVAQFSLAVALGVNLRQPEPIEKSAIWKLYLKSNNESRAYIKEKGLLTDAEIDAADVERANTPIKPFGLDSFFKN